MYDADRDTEWVPVTSSNVEAVCYFTTPQGWGVIGVMYKAKGNSPRTIYHYTRFGPGGTSPQMYRAFLDAPSKGKFRHQYLTPENGYAVDGPFNN